ncbi:MAG TPA: hypothetical protein V6D33_12610 [Cyanophyceae cyanobacterium]
MKEPSPDLPQEPHRPDWLSLVLLTLGIITFSVWIFRQFFSSQKSAEDWALIVSAAPLLFGVALWVWRRANKNRELIIALFRRVNALEQELKDHLEETEEFSTEIRVSLGAINSAIAQIEARSNRNHLDIEELEETSNKLSQNYIYVKTQIEFLISSRKSSG